MVVWDSRWVKPKNTSPTTKCPIAILENSFLGFAWLMLGKSSKHILPNRTFMVMNPMVQGIIYTQGGHGQFPPPLLTLETCWLLSFAVQPATAHKACHLCLRRCPTPFACFPSTCGRLCPLGSWSGRPRIVNNVSSVFGKFLWVLGGEAGSLENVGRDDVGTVTSVFAEMLLEKKKL